VCPKCGSTELYAGRNDKGLVVDEDKIIGCHHCDWEVDTRKKSAPKTGKPHEAQSASMKLDRTIYCVETKETWKNAFRMWKANPKFMTSAQQDALTKKLYGAAKEGRREIVKVGDLNFYLVNVAGCNPVVEE